MFQLTNLIRKRFGEWNGYLERDIKGKQDIFLAFSTGSDYLPHGLTVLSDRILIILVDYDLRRGLRIFGMGNNSGISSDGFTSLQK